MSENESEHTAEATLHTNIGRDGVIVECRRVGQDYPSESDMAHLSNERLRAYANNWTVTYRRESMSRDLARMRSLPST